MKRIHCFGMLLVDLLNGPISEYPVPHAKTQVSAEWMRILPGGGSANAASALAHMGFAVTIFAKVGGDFYGRFVRGELQQQGVDVSGIYESPQESTTFNFVGVHPDGERTFIHTPGTNRTCCLDELSLDKVLACDFLLYHDLWAMPGMDGAPAATLLAEARKRGVTTFVDEDFGYGPRKQTLEEILPHCDYLIPSFDDLACVYPGASPEQLADHFLACGTRAAVIKAGAAGCLVAQDAIRMRIPALAANVVDTTGAGDCWDAGFIAALSDGEDIYTAARIGNACAAFCIEAVGGATGVPSYVAVRQRAH